METKAEIKDAIDYVKFKLQNISVKKERVIVSCETKKEYRRYKLSAYSCNTEDFEKTYLKIEKVFEVMWPEYSVSKIDTTLKSKSKYHSVVIKVKR